jgi:ferric-dicitrate binding protein FerR (iron transport regulator)
MQITQRTWSFLLLKFLKGTISKPEREELDRQRAQSSMKEAQFKRVSSPRWMIAQLKDYHRLQKEESGERELAISPAVPETLALQPQPSFTMNWKVLAASLAGLALVTVMAYFFWSAEKTVTPASEIGAALPNKARLIWQDRPYELEQVKDGLVAQSGPFSIRKEKGMLHVEGPALYTDSATGINELVLPEGSHYKIKLPDGTLVTMNASSRIRFPTHFSGKERAVEIEGEGHLEIAKNKAVPFIVHLPNYAVEAKGTSFYVRSFPKEEKSSVLLVEGAVEIQPVKPGKPTNLFPYQRFTGSPSGETVVRVKDARSDLQAWEAGQFNLNKDLKTILQDIANWYGATLEYPATVDNPDLIGAIERNQSLAEAIKKLQPTLDAQKMAVQIQLTGNVIKVSRK